MIIGLELKKLLHQYFCIFVAIAMILTLALSAVNVFLKSISPDSQNDIIYKSYLTKLEGKLTSEKEAYILGEQARIQKILSEQNDMKVKYEKNELTVDEYQSYSEELTDAQMRSTAFERVFEDYQFIKSFQGSKIQPQFVYDTYWNDLLDPGNITPDIIVILLLLIVIVNFVVNEFDSNMWSLISSSKYGRNSVIHAKLLSSLLIGASFPIVFTFFQYLLFKIAYCIPNSDVPIQSIQYFSHVGISISILKFYILLAFLRAFAFTCFTLFVLSLAWLFKSSKTVLSICTIIIFAPLILIANSPALFTASFLGFTNMLGFFTEFRLKYKITISVLYLFITSLIFIFATKEKKVRLDRS